MSIWTLRYSEHVINHDIPALDSTIKQRIKKAIETKLLADPLTFGKPLRYSLSGQRSLRVGDYRILYHFNSQENIISITSIGHRRDIYEE